METLMITHNIDVALKYGNRLIILDEGKVVFDVSGKEKEELTREVLLSKNYHHFSDSTVLS
jgi:putative ABC transport system ATP-binding protein